eukprot:PLAT15367.2.p1 GENE.PLAT15367.2~~PLAT15367.2.p1  ORF type:complete len:486 (-),score=40.31 PLAT15367.2:125-1549(-)
MTETVCGSAAFVAAAFAPFFACEELSDVTLVLPAASASDRAQICAAAIASAGGDADDASAPTDEEGGAVDKTAVRDDAVIAATADELAAHRFVLCVNSPVLREALSTCRWREGSEGVCDLSPAVSRLAAVKMIRFMYTGKVRFVSVESAMDVLVAADYYGVQQLADVTSVYLSSALSAENACRMLEFARTLTSAEKLQKEAETVLVDDTTACLDVETTDGRRVVESLSHATMQLLVQSSDIDLDEESLFNEVVCWGEAEVQRRAEEGSEESKAKSEGDEASDGGGSELSVVLADLVGELRLGLMSAAFLMRTVLPSELVAAASVAHACAGLADVSLQGDSSMFARRGNGWESFDKEGVAVRGRVAESVSGTHTFRSKRLLKVGSTCVVTVTGAARIQAQVGFLNHGDRLTSRSLSSAGKCYHTCYSGRSMTLCVVERHGQLEVHFDGSRVGSLAGPSRAAVTLSSGMTATLSWK